MYNLTPDDNINTSFENHPVNEYENKNLENNDLTPKYETDETKN
jgi:hypothetical protein